MMSFPALLLNSSAAIMVEKSVRYQYVRYLRITKEGASTYLCLVPALGLHILYWLPRLFRFSIQNLKH